MFIDNK